MAVDISRSFETDQVVPGPRGQVAVFNRPDRHLHIMVDDTWHDLGASADPVVAWRTSEDMRRIFAVDDQGELRIHDSHVVHTVHRMQFGTSQLTWVGSDRLLCVAGMTAVVYQIVRETLHEFSTIIAAEFEVDPDFGVCVSSQSDLLYRHDGNMWVRSVSNTRLLPTGGLIPSDCAWSSSGKYLTVTGPRNTLVFTSELEPVGSIRATTTFWGPGELLGYMCSDGITVSNMDDLCETAVTDLCAATDPDNPATRETALKGWCGSHLVYTNGTRVAFYDALTGISKFCGGRLRSSIRDDQVLIETGCGLVVHTGTSAKRVPDNTYAVYHDMLLLREPGGTRVQKMGH